MLSYIDDDSKELCEVCGRKVGDSHLLISFKECKTIMFLCSKRCRFEFLRRLSATAPRLPVGVTDKDIPF